MKKVFIIHLGIGHVGDRLCKQIFDNKKNIAKQYGVDLFYIAAFTSKGGFVDLNGLTKNQIFSNSFSPNIFIADVLKKIKTPFILIDTTSSEETFPHIIHALEKKGVVVASNKKPLTASQQNYNMLLSLAKGRLFYETTVGAGLPIISTIKTLLATGDEITEITGCFSGTLGFICNSLEQNVSFSKAVNLAKAKGFTEPDPRDDLSGMDVARKALILARLIDQKKELSDIKIQKLYPDDFSRVSPEQFLQNMQQLNTHYRTLFTNAKKEDKTLRYIATVTKRQITVDLKHVAKQTIFATIQGPENIICIKTKRYNTYPLTIIGPGAGLEVTVAGILGDILTAIKESINC